MNEDLWRDLEVFVDGEVCFDILICVFYFIDVSVYWIEL